MKSEEQREKIFLFSAKRFGSKISARVFTAVIPLFSTAIQEKIFLEIQGSNLKYAQENIMPMKVYVKSVFFA